MGTPSAIDAVASGFVPFALFGIDNEGIGVILNLLVVFLIAIDFALVFWTWSDANRRLGDPVLIGAATIAAVVFPFAGALVYAIVRPPESLEDAYERELDVRAAELRVRLLEQALKSGSGGNARQAALAAELSGEPAGRRGGEKVSGSAPQSAGGARRAAAAKSGQAATSSGAAGASKAADAGASKAAARPAAGGRGEPRPSQSGDRPTRRPPASGA